MPIYAYCLCLLIGDFMFCAVMVEVVKRLLICICISEIIHIEIANIHRDLLVTLLP